MFNLEEEVRIPVPGAAGRFALEAPFIWTASNAVGIFEGTMEVVLCEPYPKSFDTNAAAAAAAVSAAREAGKDPTALARFDYMAVLQFPR